MMAAKIQLAMVDLETKAWKALAGYKFWMFGYYAAQWVNYNKLLDHKKPNPFKRSVDLGREVLQEKEKNHGRK